MSRTKLDADELYDYLWWHGPATTEHLMHRFGICKRRVNTHLATLRAKGKLAEPHQEDEATAPRHRIKACI